VWVNHLEGFCVAPFIEGCGTGAGLLIAIGAQNAFVLKQGILKNYVFITVLLCSCIDIILILLGIEGFGKFLVSNMTLLMISKWGGAAFLVYYGFRSFRAVFASRKLEMDVNFKRCNLKTTIVTTSVVCLLNPHVYLDTVVLLGSIGVQLPLPQRYFFAFGAIISSFAWFFTLGYGARFLIPFFKNPHAWKILDFIIGCIMWIIAISLIIYKPDCICGEGPVAE